MSERIRLDRFRREPLRGNSARFDVFLRPLLRAGRARMGWSVEVHRKSDAARVATATLAFCSGYATLTLAASTPREAPDPIAVDELAALFRSGLPRYRLAVATAESRSCKRGSGRDAALAALTRIARDIPPDYGAARDLVPIAEPRWLAYAGLDSAGREAWLLPRALRALRAMTAAAARDGVALALVSAFRSRVYQARIVAAKRARGQTIDAILAVNAAPGFSEHASGRAVDFTEAGYPPAETVFDTTRAFAWLSNHASRFGFRMSYPRNNRHGIDYEPWHWCWHSRR